MKTEYVNDNTKREHYEKRNVHWQIQPYQYTKVRSLQISQTLSDLKPHTHTHTHTNKNVYMHIYMHKFSSSDCSMVKLQCIAVVNAKERTIETRQNEINKVTSQQTCHSPRQKQCYVHVQQYVQIVNARVYSMNYELYQSCLSGLYKSRLLLEKQIVFMLVYE